MPFQFILFFILIFIWAGLAGIHDKMQLIIYMFLAPALTLLVSWKLKLLPAKNLFKLQFITYFFWLLKEILMSSIAVIKIACRKNLAIQPVLEPIKSIQDSDIGLVAYANSITLTPGTVTLSEEKNILLVHALDLKFMHDLQEGEMDNRVKQIVK